MLTAFTSAPAGYVILKWIDPKDEAPKEKTVISRRDFHDHWNKNHSNMVMNNATKDVWFMSHVFADRQKFKITNSELFLPESDEGNNVAEQFSNAKLLQQGKIILMISNWPN